MSHKQQMVTAARGWIGTRFHHQGRVKKSGASRGGCDCIGLIIGVADEVGLCYEGRRFSDYDQTDYERIPDGRRLKEAFCRYLTPIELNAIEPGDILMFRFDKEPQHVGIVGDFFGDLSVIHCYLQARGVVEHRLDELWKSRVVAAFAIKD